MKQRKQQSIRTIILLFFTINITLVVINYVWTLFSNNSSLEDGRYVEISKANESFIQRLGLLSNAIIKGDVELKEVLKSNLEKYESNLKSLRNGGQVVIGKEVIQIKPASHEEVILKLDELDRNWGELKSQLAILIDEPLEIDSTIFQNITIKKKEDSLQQIEPAYKTIRIPNQKIQKAYIYAQNNLDNILNKSQDLNNMYVNIFNESQVYQQNVLLVTVSFNLILLFAGMLLMISWFINPLTKISITARDVAQGDINSKVRYEQNNEIGAVADSLNLLVDNFKQYADFAINIGKGNFESNFEVKSEKDILGYSLLTMRDSLKTVSDEDKKRNWANEGFTLFSSLLRDTNKPLEELSYEIISNLVKYIDANQGGIFLMVDEGEKQYLELEASFAYNKRKFEEKRIMVGQGLLGQSVLEKEISYITKIPEDYIKISSGLGDARPNVLLIIPLILNDEIYGVMEVASFKHFDQYELDFVEKVSEDIASTVYSVRASENTRLLLEETRLNSEKMRAQEEEMRQNMEELASTQDEMLKNQNVLEEYKLRLEDQVERRTSELREKEKALSNTLVQLEGIMESTRSGIVALDNFYQVILANTQIQEFVKNFYGAEIYQGKDWFTIFKREDLKTANQKLWDRALKGDDFTIEEFYEDKEEQKIWFEITFSPIQADDGEIIGASMFMRDITSRKQSQREIERNAKILDNSTNEVYLFDAETFKFIEVNERGIKALGYTMKELEEIPFHELEPRFDEKGFEALVMPLKKKDIDNLIFETVYQRKDGTEYDVEVNLQFFAEEEQPLFAAIVQDITQRKQDEIRIKDAITRFDLVSRATNEGLWEMFINVKDPINPENEFWWSKQFKALLGFEENEFVNRLDSWSSLLHPEDKDNVLDAFYKHITDRTGRTPYNVEYRLLTKQGEYTWFTSTGETLRDNQGNPIRVAGSIRNVSRRRKIEQSLIEQTAQNEAILNASASAIIAIDMKGRIFSVNRAAVEMFGYEEEEMIGKNVKMLMLANEAENHDKYMKNYHETGQKRIIGKLREEVGKRKSGEEFPIEISISEGNIGNRKFYIGYLRDITESKENEKELVENQERFKKITEVSLQGIIFHRDGKILEVNEPFANILGYNREELLGLDFYSLIEGFSKAEVFEKTQIEHPNPYIVGLIDKNNKTVSVQFNSRILITDDNQKEHVCCILPA